MVFLLENVRRIDWELLSSIATVVGSVVAVAGVFIIWWQIRESRSITRGQLISALDSDFKAHHLELFDDILNERESIMVQKSSTELTAVLRICSYLTFFEKLYFLYKEGMLDFEVLDRLYAYRFFSVVNNQEIQDNVLYDSRFGPYLASIGDLYTEWKENRQSKNLPIPMPRGGRPLYPLQMKGQRSEGR